MPNNSVTPSRKLYSGKLDSTLRDSTLLDSTLAEHGSPQRSSHAQTDSDCQSENFSQRPSADEEKESKIQSLQRQVKDQASMLDELTRKVFHLESELLSEKEALGYSKAKIAEFEKSVQEEKAKAYALAVEEAQLAIAKEQEDLTAEYRQRSGEAIKGVLDLYTQILREAENTILEIAFSAVIKLFGEIHINNNPQYRKYLSDMIHELTMNLSTWEGLRINLSSSDYEILVGNFPAENLQISTVDLVGIPMACFVKDDAVQSGACKINSIHGELEMRLDQRIQSLRNAILAAARSSESS